jgi:hypothetical protein
MSLPRQLLVRWANQEVDIFPLLDRVGVADAHVGMLCFCPFHDDESGGKRSGKIFKDALHCYSEAKQYRAYDILRFLGQTDAQIEYMLRMSGKIPDEVALTFLDYKRIDYRLPVLQDRNEFISGRVEFRAYSVRVINSMVQQIMLNNKI